MQSRKLHGQTVHNETGRLTFEAPYPPRAAIRESGGESVACDACRMMPLRGIKKDLQHMPRNKTPIKEPFRKRPAVKDPPEPEEPPVKEPPEDWPGEPASPPTAIRLESADRSGRPTGNQR